MHRVPSFLSQQEHDDLQTRVHVAKILRRKEICSDPDYLDCRYECCTGDLCNDFDFSNDVGAKVPRPTIAATTRKYEELVRSESSESVMIATKNVEQSTPGRAAEETRRDENGERAITRPGMISDRNSRLIVVTKKSFFTQFIKMEWYSKFIISYNKKIIVNHN